MLIDTGPMVSLADARQPSHATCRAVFETADRQLTTTWACVGETMYLLGRKNALVLRKQLMVLFHLEYIRLLPQSGEDFLAQSALMSQYQDIPMDLADASLVTASDSLNDRTIFTLDKHFRIYRTGDGGYFDVVL